ncbi:acyl-CoA dehydrogenase family protein [Derxia gummosa]|uniref:Acyl-CoA dehydrogenase family protein n=1 Tax=Derxia gummosa DSM 723 TaxID=1121388 RepID=A0A8B6X9X5_9BURK|nr:acyl-CoA dehydrogenase family protein [Derxia gummosa]
MTLAQPATRPASETRTEPATPDLRAVAGSSVNAPANAAAPSDAGHAAHPAAHAAELPARARLIPPADPLAAADALAADLARTAVERDRAGGHAAAERDLIRASGLLTLSVPTAFGGAGSDWPTIFDTLRRVARADSALGHVYGFHHLQIAGLFLYGDEDQQALWLRRTIEHGLFWGNALNPLDKRTVATDTPEGFTLHGSKTFCSGSVGSDALTLSAWHPPTDSLLIGVLPTRRAGITVNADWDAFGQKQTDSGTVDFDHVRIAHDEVTQKPGIVATPWSTLRSCIAQLVMANLYTGIAEGAFAAATGYSRDRARPWFASGVAASLDDPFIQRRYGELWSLLRPAQVLSDLAARKLQDVLDLGPALVTAAHRGDIAVAVAEAKVCAHRAALEIGTQIFDITGASATSARNGFDRYWRNARVHTLHDPLDYKLRDLGRYATTGRVPDPTAYS